ncbi:hypothetical protein C5167_017054 [Papaver somniferum]|uniref:DUF3511 domain-containing protein n=1 Tax=Papaver somniferum TaxID=3469 RepID=A0A4Y7ILN3_PAPSO|nr:hypothetical protein C5167_017054 [Papaver somniferum]
MTDLWSGYRPSINYGRGVVDRNHNHKLEVLKGNELVTTKQIFTTTSQPPRSCTDSSRGYSPRSYKHKESRVSSSSKSTSSWSFNDPEMKRRRRVAQYKYYAVEGKLKSSFRKGFRWVKRKCSNIARAF